jgi:hypothetical protein
MTMPGEHDYDDRMQADIQEIKQTVKTLQALLIGDGEVGLCEQMRDAVRRTIENDVRSTTRWRIFLASIGLLSLALVWHLAGGNPVNVPGVILKIIAGA